MDRNDSKLTPVFVGVNPAHPGVYLTHQPASNLFAKWDGKVWKQQRHSAKEAARCNRAAAFQNKPWQGLKEKPRA